jgi:hypothetical protein
MRVPTHLFGAIGLLGVCLVLVSSPLLANSADKDSPEVLRNIPLTRGWKDDSGAAARPKWQPLSAEQPEAGVRLEFPVIKNEEWFNLYLPFRPGAWPQGGTRALFQARADKPAKFVVRLNEMPGAGEGNLDRNAEFEAHGIAFDATAEWHDIVVDLQNARKLWGNSGGNGKLDLEKITGIGFEPADAARPAKLEVRNLRLVQGGKREGPALPPKGGLKVTARVEGYTQATQFNPQKYPFKYTGASTLDADQLKALGQAGDVPAAVSRALLECLLWPQAGDKLEKVALKSDGKKLSGEVEVSHRYGKQGTHVLKLRLEGTLDGGRLTLKAVEPGVSGTWDYGGGTIKLGGKVDIQFEAAP